MSPPRKLFLRLLLLGALVLPLLTGLAGAVWASGKPQSYTAEATLLVHPSTIAAADPNLAREVTSVLSDPTPLVTLSTLAENSALISSAGAAAGLTSAQMSGVQVETQTPVGGAVLDVLVTAEDRDVAIQLRNALVLQLDTTFSDSFQVLEITPFLQSVSQDPGGGLSWIVGFVAGAIVGLALGWLGLGLRASLVERWTF